jgi:hypothetical protein
MPTPSCTTASTLSLLAKLDTSNITDAAEANRWKKISMANAMQPLARIMRQFDLLVRLF